MTPPFFPDFAFGWAFVVVLAAFLAAASVTDLRYTVIPKTLTLSALPVGLLFNSARLAWIAHDGGTTWLLPTGNAAVGALDGLLFAVVGFVVAFAMFFALWFLGVCGGGDVKLFAAVGTWIGMKLSIFVLCVTLILLSALVLFQALKLVLSGQFRKLHRRRSANSPAKTKRRLITFALPLTVATLLVLAWAFRFELRLQPAQPAAALVSGVNHAL